MSRQTIMVEGDDGGGILTALEQNRETLTFPLYMFEVLGRGEYVTANDFEALYFTRERYIKDYNLKTGSIVKISM